MSVYQPFISNLSSYVALMLENRWQKDLLQKANDELERKVKERTHELTAANEALAGFRLAALNMMDRPSKRDSVRNKPAPICNVKSPNTNRWNRSTVP